MKKVMMIMAVSCMANFFTACSDARRTVKADPHDPLYEPMHRKGSPGYDNVHGSQFQEIREDVRNDRELNIKHD